MGWVFFPRAKMWIIRERTSAKCPVLVRPLQDIKTRQKLVLPLLLCVKSELLSHYPCTNWPLNCNLDAAHLNPKQACWLFGAWAFVTNLCCTLVPSSLPSRFCCHSGHRYDEWRSHLSVDKTCCSQTHSNVLHRSHGSDTRSGQLLHYVSRSAIDGLGWSCQSGMPSQ